MIALFLQFQKLRSSDSFHLRNDVIGVFKLNNPAKFLRVEHIEHMAAVSHLHGGGVSITVTRHNLNSITLKFQSHFFSKFATPQKKRFATNRGHYRANFCHSQ